MALLNFGGFETGDNREAGASSTSGNSAVQSGTKRTGAYSLRMNPQTVARYQRYAKHGTNGKEAVLALTTAYVSIYFRITAGQTGSTVNLLSLGSASADTVLLGYKASAGTLTFGGSATNDSSATAWTGAWFRADITAVTNGASSVSLYDEAGTFIETITGTGANVTMDYLWCGTRAASPGNAADWYLDDWAISDSAIPGPLEVKVAVPTGNSATNTAWSASAGNKWACIDEVPTSATDYIESLTTAGDQRYSATHDSCATLGIRGDIIATKVLAVLWEPTSTTTLGTVGIRSGSTNFGLTAADIGNTTEVPFARVDATDPNTSSAWTTGGVDAAEPMVHRSTSDTSNIRCKWMGLMILSVGGKSGTSALTLPFPVLTATGVKKYPGTSAMTLPFPVMTATGSQAGTSLSGTSALVLPFPVMTATGRKTYPGTSALVLPFPVLTASGLLRDIAAGTMVLPFPVMVGTGLYTPNTITGTGALTLPFPVLASSGVMRPKGTAALTLPFPVLTATGLKVYEGIGAFTLPFPVLSATGQHIDIQGIGAVTLPFPVMTAVGARSLSGVSVLTLPFPVLTGAGVHTDIQGMSVLVLPFPIMSATGLRAFAGVGQFTLPFPVMVASGTYTVLGTSGLVLPFPTLTATGAQTISGTGSLVLPFPSMVAVGQSLVPPTILSYAIIELEQYSQVVIFYQYTEELELEFYNASIPIHEFSAVNPLPQESNVRSM